MAVKINGRYDGHGVSWPTKIKRLFRPIKFCGSDKVQYTFSALTEFLDDVSDSGGSLVYIALESDLKHFKDQPEPFIYVKGPLPKKICSAIRATEEGQDFTLRCGCVHRVMPISKFPAKQLFKIIITGCNVDER